MKVAILSPWAVSSTAVGGTERFIVDLAESLRTSGHVVDVYMFDGRDHTNNGVHYTPLHLLGDLEINEYTLAKHLGDFSQSKTYDLLAEKVASLVDISSYDVVHINTQLLLRAWPEKRRIFTIHTNPFEYKQAWGDASYETMIRIAQDEISESTVFTAPSEYYAHHFTNELGTPVHFIPHAINSQRVQPLKPKDVLLNDYELDAAKLHILLPSRLEPVQKQPWLLFDALQYLPQSILERLEILSSGVDSQYEPYKKSYEKQAQDLGCSVYFGRFTFMSDAYTMADIVVLPTQSESFGYAALESLSLGIPTVMNNIPTLKEIAVGSSTAYFFNNNAKELAGVLEQIFNNVERKSPSKAWVDRYAMTSWVKKYEELFDGKA